MKKGHLLKMIKDGFNKMVKEKKMSEDSAKSHFKNVRIYVNTKLSEKVAALGSEKYYSPNYWKGNWADEWVDDMVERYENDQLVATTIENRVHSLHKLADLVKEENFFGNKVEKIRVGLKGSVKEGRGHLFTLHQEGVVDDKGHVTSMKPKGDELERIIAEIPKTNRNYESIVCALTSQAHTGGRIKAELSLRVGAIDYTIQTKKYIKDKNKFTRNVPIANEHMDYYKALEWGKNQGAPLYPIFDKNGKEMSPSDASRYVQEVLNRAVEKAGVNYEDTIIKTDKNGKEREVAVTMRYTSHSTRRGFAQKQYDKTRYWTKDKIKEAIGDYVNLQGSNKEKILKRMENERKRINYHRIKKGQPEKEFSWEQLRRMYVSLQLGHSRIDIVARYVDLDKPIHERKSWKK